MGLFTKFPFWAESVVVQARANNEWSDWFLAICLPFIIVQKDEMALVTQLHWYLRFLLFSKPLITLVAYIDSARLYILTDWGPGVQ